jgi:D-alanyl-D-alanine carboxypeptidase
VKAPDPRLSAVQAALDASLPELGESAVAGLRSRIEADPEGFLDQLEALAAPRAADPSRFLLVDKRNPPLAPDWEAPDLLPLDGSGLLLARPGLLLRAGARQALLALDAAARAAGLRLVVGSAYRSYAYQTTVFAREVASYGEEQARRESAEPGRSQHQLGTALDFSPIGEDFDGTADSAWLEAHAAAFGFSRSYPEGLEAVTGYQPESWHWRWLGPEALRLQESFFGGVQHYLLVFLSRLQD